MRDKQQQGIQSIMFGNSPINAIEKVPLSNFRKYDKTTTSLGILFFTIAIGGIVAVLLISQ